MNNMKSIKSIKWVTSLAILLIIGFQVNGQDFTKYNAVDSSKVFISGTSTLHNWKEQLKKFTVTVLVEQNKTDGIVFKNIRFTAPVGELKGESSLMDNKTFKAMKKDKYPTISFSSKDEIKLPVVENKFTGKVSGILTIAGVEKQVTVEVKGVIGHGLISVSGIYSVSMSDYGITAPTFLFGTIKTGNVVKVHFNLKFNKIYNTFN